MLKKSIKDILKEIYLFSNLNEEEILDLVAISSVHKYTKGSYLFMKGEMSKELLVLSDGLLTVFKHDSKGNEIIIGAFKAYSLLAEPAILQKIPFPSSAMFKSDGAVIKINLEKFNALFLHNPHISYEIIQSLLGKIQLLQNNIHMNIASTAKEKILHFYEQNHTLGTELKKYEIASLLGITAETFSRNIKQLLKEKKLFQTTTGYKVFS